MGKSVIPLSAACIVSASICLGCRFEPPKQNSKLAPVSGIVTLNGEPLPRAIVKFESIDNRPSSDTTKADGRYELSYDHRQKGAWIGSHVVRISKHFNPMTEKPPIPLPDRYDSRSELKVRVQPGENVFDFHLTDDDADQVEADVSPAAPLNDIPADALQPTK